MEQKECRVLIVDDEAQVCVHLGKLLSLKGFAVLEAHNGQEALEILDANFVEVVLLDVKMPVMDGVEALGRIKNKFPDIEVIMVTAFSDLSIGVECMQKGAYGYLTKPVDAEGLVMEVRKALERRKLRIQIRIYEKQLEMKVDEKTAETQYLYKLLENAFARSIHLFVDLLALSDPLLAGHSKRVAELAVTTGEKAGLNAQRLLDLEQAALLHDIGKLGVPERIRHLPLRELGPKEVAAVEKQSVGVQKTLESVGRLQRAGLIIRGQMERVDGKGFPDGLKGDEILLESKVLAVVSAFDEIAYDSQGNAPNEQQAETYVKHHTGSRYDRKVVEKFLEAFEEYKRLKRQEWAVPFAELKEGMVLTRDVMDQNGKLVLSKGSILHSIQLTRLKNHDLFTSPIAKKIFVQKQSVDA